MPSDKINRYIFSTIKDADFVFLFAHKECPDGLGAASAFSSVLDSLKKRYVWWSGSSVPQSLQFIHNTEKIISDADIDLEEFDVIVSIDNSDIKQTGIAEKLKYARGSGGSFIINIDHHISNDFFGHFNAVNTKASAACELIYDFYSDNNLKLSQKTAESLLAGIIADTGNFTNNATNIKSMQISSHLLTKGASLPKLVQTIIEPKSRDIAILNLWGAVFSRLVYDAESGIASTVITQNDLSLHNLSLEATEGIANFMNNLKDIKAALVLTELPDNKIKGSLRTTRPDVDVAALAAKLGGGGHKKAAGFTITGRLNRIGKGMNISKLLSR